MEAIEPRLLDFLRAEKANFRVLVVEGAHYLPLICAHFPRTEVYAVAADAEMSARENLKNLDISWVFADYLTEPLPFSREFFDYIISDLTLEEATNPQDIAAGFSQFLKQTGVFLTSFRNIRHWSILQDLMEGHFYHLGTRPFTKSEFGRLLYSSYYKDVRFAPQIRPAPEDLRARLLLAGFEDMEEIDAEFYMVYAARSMPELSLLKSMYTAEDRKILGRILHRIEYEILLEDSVADFWRIYEKLPLFPDYLAEFAHEAVAHRADFYRNLWAYSKGREGICAEILSCALDFEDEGGAMFALREELFGEVLREGGDA